MAYPFVKTPGRAIHYIFCGEPRHKRMPLLSLTQQNTEKKYSFNPTT
jgi:hypothetical protein